MGENTAVAAQVLLPLRSVAQGLRRAARKRGKLSSAWSSEISLSPIAVEDGLWIVAGVRDISERVLRKELEQQNARIVEANRMKTMFLANMSHELRTPLNAVIGFAELLHDGQAGALNAEQKEFLQYILTGAQHLLSLINGMLDVARIEAGRMEFHPTTFALAQLLGEVRDSMQVLATQRRLELVVELDPALERVTTDALKLKQVLLNFLSNAVKFSPEGGRIYVRSKRAGPLSFRVEVEDSGAGIPPTQLAHLFVEFQQLDLGYARGREGTGLGLALTKRIVEAQGGQVGVSSVLGQGSVFFAVLPLNAHAEGAANEPS